MDRGAKACIPANLTDEWTYYLEEELSFLDNETGIMGEGPDLSCSLAAITTIMIAKNNSGKEYSAIVDELLEKFTDFRIELGFEIVRRHTEIKLEPATLVSIFANRTVRILKKEH